VRVGALGEVALPVGFADKGRSSKSQVPNRWARRRRGSRVGSERRFRRTRPTWRTAPAAGPVSTMREARSRPAGSYPTGRDLLAGCA